MSDIPTFRVSEDILRRAKQSLEEHERECAEVVRDYLKSEEERIKEFNQTVQLYGARPQLIEDLLP